MYDEEDGGGEIKLWFFFAIIFGSLLIFIFAMHFKEYRLIQDGTSITVPYTEDATYVSFIDEKGVTHIVDLEGLPVKVTNHQITIYYYIGKDHEAKAETEPFFWILIYTTFSSIVVLSLYKCYKHFRRTYQYNVEAKNE